jgi:hypothetical protein
MKMSELAVDPLGGLPSDVGESTARDHAAVLVKGDAVSVDAANAALAAKGFAPLNANSSEYFAARKEALLGDSEFMAAYGRGDPGAISSLYQIDLRISQASGKLTDRSIAQNDPAYDAVRREVGRNVTDAATYTTYSGELTGLASSIGMPPASAAALAEDHFQALRHTAGMSHDEAAAYGENEVASLHAAIGEGAEAKLAEASKVLSQKSGRKLDLNAIARTNSARVAANLYFVSMSIKGVK